LGQWRLDFAKTTDAVTSIFDLHELTFADSCDPQQFEKFASKVHVAMNTSTTAPPTEMELEQLAQLFQEAYTAENELNDAICDPYFRKVTTVRAYIETNPSKYSIYQGEEDAGADADADSPFVYLDFYVAGFCQDCGPTTNLFDTDNNQPSRRRRREEELDEERCLCPLDAEERGPTQVEFFNEFFKSIKDLNFVTALVDVDEVDPTVCDSQLVDFTQVVLVALHVNATAACEGGILLEDDILSLEIGFLKAYNGLQATFCDPHFRTLESASVLRIGNNQNDDTTRSIEIRVSGKCRGCDPDAISIYEIPTTSTSSVVSNRFLFEAGTSTLDDSNTTSHRRRLETCYCATDATEERAPTEAEFMHVYQSYVASLPLSSCVSSIGECGFGSIFETAIIASFDNTDNDNAVSDD
jgi:hypothetical protein